MRADFVADLDMYDLILEIRLLAENQQPRGGLKICWYPHVYSVLYCTDEFGRYLIYSEGTLEHLYFTNVMSLQTVVHSQEMGI